MASGSILILVQILVLFRVESTFAYYPLSFTPTIAIGTAARVAPSRYALLKPVGYVAREIAPGRSWVGIKSNTLISRQKNQSMMDYILRKSRCTPLVCSSLLMQYCLIDTCAEQGCCKCRWTWTARSFHTAFEEFQESTPEQPSRSCYRIRHTHNYSSPKRGCVDSWLNLI